MPSPRSNATWVFDAKTGKFILFGGNYTTGNYNEFPQPLGDTWSWDGTTWTQLDSTATSPVARMSAPAVYDPVHGVVLLHGGVTASASLNDTWTWDGTRWFQMGPAQSPTPTPGLQPMCWDSARGDALLYDWTGLWAAPPLDQTWTWDGTNWKHLPTTAAPVGSQGYGLLAYDPGRNLNVFFGKSLAGPETWTFNGTSWSQIPGNGGTASATFAAVGDVADSDIVLLGENGDTWTWNGSKWSPANPIHSPGARRGAALTYDSVHNDVVLFGGSTGTGSNLQLHNDIWTWNGTDWTKVNGN